MHDLAVETTERAALAALAMSTALGEVGARKLRQRFSTLARAAQAPVHALRATGVGHDGMRAPDLASGAAAIARWEAAGLQLLVHEDPAYPDAWRTLAHPPAFVLLRGDAAALSGSLVAIIGTRRATPYGRTVTKRFVAAAARADVGTVAGLALGIDTVTHEASLAQGIPTVAVLAGGHDRMYPKPNANLADRIARAGGAVVSEVVPDTDPLPQRFVARNRLVAALARCVVVVEAGVPSGTLTTVAHAVELGREVAVVPGPITSASSEGCNKLLAEGSTPLWSVAEFERLLETVGGSVDPVVAAVRRGAGTVDALVHAVGLPARELLVRLTQLELQGSVRRTREGRYIS